MQSLPTPSILTPKDDTSKKFNEKINNVEVVPVLADVDEIQKTLLRIPWPLYEKFGFSLDGISAEGWTVTDKMAKAFSLDDEKRQLLSNLLSNFIAEYKTLEKSQTQTLTTPDFEELQIRSLELEGDLLWRRFEKEITGLLGSPRGETLYSRIQGHPFFQNNISLYVRLTNTGHANLFMSALDLDDNSSSGTQRVETRLGEISANTIDELEGRYGHIIDFEAWLKYAVEHDTDYRKISQ